ncbi:MAG: hypothetical protein NQ127_03700 [Candidatus Cardinium sp.]|nr:hypothetical protein [Candidatus Cardinium sp.]
MLLIFRDSHNLEKHFSYIPIPLLLPDQEGLAGYYLVDLHRPYDELKCCYTLYIHIFQPDLKELLHYYILVYISSSIN